MAIALPLLALPAVPRFWREFGAWSREGFEYNPRITELYKALIEAGATPDAAEHAADAITRQDLAAFEARVLGHLNTTLAETKTDIIKWLAGLMIAQGAAVAALVKLLS